MIEATGSSTGRFDSSNGRYASGGTVQPRVAAADACATPLNARSLDGADMTVFAASLAVLLASTGVSEGKRCPAVTQSLLGAGVFSTVVGLTQCVTAPAQAFLILYRASDVAGLRTLAEAQAAGAQLYGLCGLKHLHRDAEADALRKKLGNSRLNASIEFGDEGPAPMTAVSKLVFPQAGQNISEFDTTCDYLVEHGKGTKWRTCDPAIARLTCR